MIGYFITEETMCALVRNVRDAMSDYTFARLSDGEVAKEIIRQASGEPIEVNDASISELNTPCKYYLKANIVGFAQKNGHIMGVFIKEEL